jgi:Mg-chelatase subunit ChlD
MARIKASFGNDSKEVASPGTNAPTVGGQPVTGLSFKERMALKPGRAQRHTGVDYVQILIDASGSMGAKMDDGTGRMPAAKAAVNYFLDNSKPHQCAVGCTAFGVDDHFGVKTLISPTFNYNDVKHEVAYLQPTGFTPLAEALHLTIRGEIITRVIVVSDGAPDSEDKCFDSAREYIEKRYPIDTIYIGDRKDRAYEFMKKLAEMTGGIFAFVSDLSAFKAAMGQLETSARLLIADQRG